MKITVVTDRKGRLIASILEPQPKRKAPKDKRTPSAALRPGPDQVFQEIAVPDHYRELSGDDLHEALRKRL
jgi:hypothetical protein